MIFIESCGAFSACVHWTPDAPGQRPPQTFLQLLIANGAEPNRPHEGFELATKRVIPLVLGLNQARLPFEQSLYPALGGRYVPPNQKRVC